MDRLRSSAKAVLDALLFLSGGGGGGGEMELSGSEDAVGTVSGG